MNAAAQTEGRPGTALYSRAAVDPKSIADDSRSVDVIASTEALDAHGTVIRQNWQLERYRAYPVVLFAHDQTEMPIGLASNIRIEDGSLRATLNFSAEELNPKAEQVWKNVKAGVLRGVSIGFWPHTMNIATEEDRSFLVLDDNELFEISMVPVPSNPETLASMRARAMSSRSPQHRPPAAPPPAAAAKQAAPVAQRGNPMTEPQLTPTIVRALGLPVGSTETDAIACATRQHELEVGVVAILSLQSSAEALGAIRGLKAKADKFDEMATKLAAVEGERDKQNFEVQIQRAVNERKMSKASIDQERRDFEEAVGEGRGARAVSRLKGFLDTAPVIHAERHVQPKTPGNAEGEGVPLLWNGKAYRNMKPMERARLAKAEPDLFETMKREWEAAGRPNADTSAA